MCAGVLLQQKGKQHELYGTWNCVGVGGGGDCGLGAGLSARAEVWWVHGFPRGIEVTQFSGLDAGVRAPAFVDKSTKEITMRLMVRSIALALAVVAIAASASGCPRKGFTASPVLESNTK